jgi:hypothetical protein
MDDTGTPEVARRPDFGWGEKLASLVIVLGLFALPILSLWVFLGSVSPWLWNRPIDLFRTPDLAVTRWCPRYRAEVILCSAAFLFHSSCALLAYLLCALRPFRFVSSPWEKARQQSPDPLISDLAKAGGMTLLLSLVPQKYDHAVRRKKVPGGAPEDARLFSFEDYTGRMIKSPLPDDLSLPPHFRRSSSPPASPGNGK